MEIREKLTILNSVIKNSLGHLVCESEGGGTIYFKGGDMTVTNSRFEGNGSSTTWANGAAISYVGSGKLMISGSTFKSNQSNGGGALYVANTSETVEITDSVFEDNVAISNNGGAIYAAESISMSITSSTFKDNESRLTGGGAIYTSGGSGTLTITSSTFQDNSSGETGGAIKLRSIFKLSVTGSAFKGNESGSVNQGHGGAIFAEGLDDNTSTLTITDSSFRDQYAQGLGGAIWVEKLSSMAVLGSAFDDNESTDSGGAITVYDTEGNTSITITNSGIHRQCVRIRW